MTTLWAILAMTTAGDPASLDSGVLVLHSRASEFSPKEIAEFDRTVRAMDVQLCLVVGSSASAAWTLLESVLQGSAVIRERVGRGSLKVQAALHDAIRNPMAWLGSHPDQNRLLSSSVRVARPIRASPLESLEPSRVVSRNLLLVMPGILLLGAGVMLGLAYSRRKDWRRAARIPQPEEALAQM